MTLDRKKTLWGMGSIQSPLRTSLRPELIAIKGNPAQRQLQMQLLCTSLSLNEKTTNTLRLGGCELDRKEVQVRERGSEKEGVRKRE